MTDWNVISEAPPEAQAPGNGNGEWVWRSTTAMDETASSYERRWGMDRLQHLAPPNLATRFQSACDMRDAEWPRATAERREALAAMMARAWAALEDAAIAAGHQPMPTSCFEVAVDHPDRKLCCLAFDDAHAQTLRLRNKAEGRDVEVWSLAEVATAMLRLSVVSAIKAEWDGATVRGRATDPVDITRWPRGGDPVPSLTTT